MLSNGTHGTPKILNFFIHFIDSDGQRKGIQIGSFAGKGFDKIPLSIDTFIPGSEKGSMDNDHPATEKEKETVLALMSKLLFPGRER